MDVRVIFFGLNFISLCICREQQQEYFLRNVSKADNLTLFPKLINGQVKAKAVSDKAYEWSARVVLSRKGIIPFLCNAICIEKRIFLTASRCVLGISLYYTRIIYKRKHLKIIAEISPKRYSPQHFDDISFIVTTDLSSKDKWVTLDMYKGPNRTDGNYKWLENMNIIGNPKRHKIVSYAATVFSLYQQNEKTNFSLYELEVIIGLQLCQSIYTRRLMTGYYFPCAFPCIYKEFLNNSRACQYYLGVEGAAVFNFKTNKLLGVMTWGDWETDTPKLLPVGFAIPNTRNFWKNYQCARLIIKKDRGDPVKLGYYNDLCKTIK